METVFDHNITKEEKEAVLGFADSSIEEFDDWTQIDHYGLIYRLYIYRGDRKTAQRYADLIPDTVAKVFGLCNHDFAVMN
jgi:hypothetical protein